MIKIGDFARMGGVSVATLRHYDDVGVLQPSRVDDASGYRYYEIAQIWRLRRILALKDLGLTLQETSLVLKGEPTPKEMREMLERKLAETARRMEEEAARLKRIEHRILLIEKENIMSELTVEIKSVPPTTIASRRIHIPTNDQAGDLLGKAHCQLMESIKASGMEPAGPCLAVWYSSPDTFTDEVVDAAVPVSADCVEADGYEVQNLPTTEVASVTHRGPFEEFIDGHRVLTTWMETQGYRLSGPYREIYHSHTSEEAVTEIQYPVERR